VYLSNWVDNLASSSIHVNACFFIQLSLVTEMRSCIIFVMLHAFLFMCLKRADSHSLLTVRTTAELEKLWVSDDIGDFLGVCSCDEVHISNCGKLNLKLSPFSML